MHVRDLPTIVKCGSHASQARRKWGQVLNRESLTGPNHPVERTAHSGSFFP
jgi:hypothetical protein